MSEDIPIDIPYAKLAEWLEDRSTKLKKEHPQLYDEVLQVAPILLQNVKYEIPALKDDVSRAQASLRDIETTILDSHRRREDANHQLQTELAEVHLSGCDEEDLFACIQQQVPVWMSRVVEDVRRVVPPCLQYYESFWSWQRFGAGGDGEHRGGMTLLPIFHHILDQGNTPLEHTPDHIRTMTSTNESELDDCVPLLLNDSIRGRLCDEALELQAFLGTRCQAEPDGSADHAAMLSVTAPQCACNLTVALKDVTELLCTLQGKATTHLLLLRSSPQYRSRVLTGLRLLQQKAARYYNVACECEEQREALERSLAEAAPKLQSIVAETKSLQQSCERSLRKIYHPREVNLVGAINAL